MHFVHEVAFLNANVTSVKNVPSYVLLSFHEENVSYLLGEISVRN